MLTEQKHLSMFLFSALRTRLVFKGRVLIGSQVSGSLGIELGAVCYCFLCYFLSVYGTYFICIYNCMSVVLFELFCQLLVIIYRPIVKCIVMNEELN